MKSLAHDLSGLQLLLLELHPTPVFSCFTCFWSPILCLPPLEPECTPKSVLLIYHPINYAGNARTHTPASWVLSSPGSP